MGAGEAALKYRSGELSSEGKLRSWSTTWPPRKPQPPKTRTVPRDLEGGLAVMMVLSWLRSSSSQARTKKLSTSMKLSFGTFPSHTTRMISSRALELHFPCEHGARTLSWKLSLSCDLTVASHVWCLSASADACPIPEERQTVAGAER